MGLRSRLAGGERCFVAVGSKLRDGGVKDLRAVPGTGEKDEGWFGHSKDLCAGVLWI